MGDPFRPPWLRFTIWASSAAAIVLNLAAAAIAEHHGYSGFQATHPTPEQVENERYTPPAGCDVPVGKDAFIARHVGVCVEQLEERTSKIHETREELRVACDRHRFAWTSLPRNDPDARRTLKEETEQASKLTKNLRGLVGAPLSDRQTFVAMLVAMLLTLEATGQAFAWHARRARIGAPKRFGEIAVPFAVSALATFIVAAVVTYIESVDPRKTGFDAMSYCFMAIPFWLSHATLLPVALVVAAPLAVGWYASRPDHVPELDGKRYQWGVRPYVTFIETWSFLAIVLTGVTAATWMHTIADAPSRTNRIVALLGAGAVVIVILILARLVWCGMLLRRKYLAVVESTPDWKDLPPDPLDGFVGERWWITPLTLAAAFGLAYKVLELAGAFALVGSSN